MSREGLESEAVLPAAPAVAPDAKELARQIRAAKRLPPALKRSWLQVVPHLHDDDRRRLAAILRGEPD